MRRALAAIPLLACGGGPERDVCAAIAAAPAPARRVEAPALGLSLGAFGDVVRASEGGVDVERERTPRTVSALGLRRRAPGEACPATACALPGGGVVALTRVEGGGSGGPAAGYEGCLDVGGGAYRVSCVDQPGEGATPDPDWCLPYLASARRAPD